MSDSVLARLFEHNNWANSRTIDACSALSAEHLDARPRSATRGSIRKTLSHLIRAQQSYVRLLTGLEPSFAWNDDEPPSMENLRESLTLSGERLLELARDERRQGPSGAPIRTRDGHLVERWVLMVQAINHATEHREQISSMLTSLGITPPDNDGWSYAEAANAMTPPVP